MDLTEIPLFALADRRLAWVSARQSVLAQNIANADTPGFRAKDLSPFGAALAQAALPLAATASGHLPGSTESLGRVLTVTGETSPDGNSVAIDRELVKVAEADSAHEAAIGVTKSYLSMFRTVIGR